MNYFQTMKFKTFLLLLLGILFIGGTAYGQGSVQEELSRRNITLSEAQNMARQAGINPNNPTELRRFAKANGVPDSQINQWLEEMGMSNPEKPSGQIQDLRDTTVSSDEIEMVSDTTQIETQVQVEPEPEEEGLTNFGYKIFSSTPDAFKPDAIGPVDEGYIVGPNDEMRLTMWGATQLQYELEVDSEGRILIPNVGQLTVAGQTLKYLREYLKMRLSKSYAGLAKDPPTIFLDVTLTRLRPVRIFVIGEVDQPGGYTVSSYSTLFNALYAVGGPTQNGSLRDIKLIRNGEVVSTFDLYEFLLTGIDSGSIKLQNNDRIFIPQRLNTIKIRGPVNRPAIYEFKPGEGLEDLLHYAGNLKPEAYGKRFHVERIIPMQDRKAPSVAREVKDFNLMDVLNGELEYIPKDGDDIRISSISDRVEDVVYLEGAVFQPGSYEIQENEIRTVKDLILSADSLKGDAIKYKVEVIRTDEDLTQTMISLDLEKILKDDPYHNIVLRRLDRVRVFSRTELEDNYTVSISGAISNPDSYRWRDSLTVYDLLFKGKGLFDSESKEKVYLKRADLVRRTDNGRNSIVIPFNLEQALENKRFGTTKLQPFDEIKIYPNTVELIDDKFVVINGAVKNPGRYEFNENMTLEDILITAGGFLESSSLTKVEVSRLVKPEKAESKSLQFFWPLLGDELGNEFYHPSLADTLFTLAGNYKLEHRDYIYVRTNEFFETQQEIVLQGEVRFPGSYSLITENESLSSVIERAGGITSEGYPLGATLNRGGQKVVIELDDIIKGNKESDIIMKPGDTLSVPKTPNTVLVTGNVALDGYIKYKERERLSYYLDQAGGMLKDSYKYVRLEQPSGATYQVRRKGLFKPNPRVRDGATIRVIYEEPEPKTEQRPASEILQQSLALLTSTLTVIVLIDRAFR